MEVNIHHNYASPMQQIDACTQYCPFLARVPALDASEWQVLIAPLSSSLA